MFPALVHVKVAKGFFRAYSWDFDALITHCAPVGVQHGPEHHEQVVAHNEGTMGLSGVEHVWTSEQRIVVQDQNLKTSVIKVVVSTCDEYEILSGS